MDGIDSGNDQLDAPAPLLGGGTVRFSDGTEGSFVFGEGATTI